MDGLGNSVTDDPPTDCPIPGFPQSGEGHLCIAASWFQEGLLYTFNAKASFNSESIEKQLEVVLSRTSSCPLRIRYGVVAYNPNCIPGLK